MKFKRFSKALTTVVVVLTLVLSTFAPAFAAKVTKVKITNKITKMDTGSSKQLTVVTTPKGAKVAWATSNKKVATVANGKVSALAAGTVKITASVGKVSDSVTIKVAKAGKAAATPTKGATASTGASSNGLVNQDFAKDQGAFTPRGGVTLTWVDKAGSDGKNGYLEVTGRSATWNGAIMDVTDKCLPGKTYHVEGWVRYTKGEATEKFKLTGQKNSDAYPAISGDVDVEKGKWTKLEGSVTVDADATQFQVYFETSSNAALDFDCDSLVITQE